jgi:hypothetical protein
MDVMERTKASAAVPATREGEGTACRWSAEPHFPNCRFKVVSMTRGTFNSMYVEENLATTPRFAYDANEIRADRSMGEAMP